MRNAFVFLIVMVFASTAFAQNDTLKQDEIIYTTDEFFCDEGLQPEFPGGNNALRKYLVEHLKIPDCAYDAFSGKVWIRFIVMKNGKIAQVEIIRGVEDCPEFETMVKSLFYGMPAWKPGVVNDEPVNAYFQLPLYIHLAH